jgi:hypothetical protein
MASLLIQLKSRLDHQSSFLYLKDAAVGSVYAKLSWKTDFCRLKLEIALEIKNFFSHLFYADKPSNMNYF